MEVAHIVAVDEVKNTTLAAANDEMRKRTGNRIQKRDRSSLAEVYVVRAQRGLIVGCKPVREGQPTGSVKLQKAVPEFCSAIVVPIAADYVKIIAAVKDRCASRHPDSTAVAVRGCTIGIGQPHGGCVVAKDPAVPRLVVPV